MSPGAQTSKSTFVAQTVQSVSTKTQTEGSITENSNTRTWPPGLKAREVSSRTRDIYLNNHSLNQPIRILTLKLYHASREKSYNPHKHNYHLFQVTPDKPQPQVAKPNIPQVTVTYKSVYVIDQYKTRPNEKYICYNLASHI